ncbi:hypothetical protein [Streptomyces sp. G-G2]|uniref:hypothetical protein n=1 Tax=Streptomyces sp. G-G2 TaxID=3046201 RepID=UPI0024BA8C06|nr:hypothetical protein [Streptomyces sp. G-G2]MDJ0382546.1 hypothetical protein [Streptomyces sp. G-G2]
MGAAFIEEPGAEGAVRRLAAEGVTPWLEGVPGVGPERVREFAERLGVVNLLYGGPRRAAVIGPVCDVLLPLGGLVAATPPGGASPYDAARALVSAVARPNLIVVLPASGEGLAAGTRLLGEGIGVTFGPMTGPRTYEGVLGAWLGGLERARERGLDLAALPVFASLCVRDLGPLAVPTARLLYERYDRTLGGPRWRDLAAAGARPHRLMWTALGDRAEALPGLIGWGTAAALTLRALQGLPTLRGDTLSPAPR